MSNARTCPNCGGPVFYNVRGGDWFVGAPYKTQRRKYQDWLKENRGNTILFIDIGTGFHTPVWIRWPFEKMTLENPNATLVRINPQEPHVPKTIGKRSIVFPNRAMEVITAVGGKKIVKRRIVSR